MLSSDDHRAMLDAEYNLRAAVPEFPAYFERYDARSAAFRARSPGLLDLAYGPGPRQGIDLFRPETEGAPLLVFIHGGYWQNLDRKTFSFVAEPAVAAGAAVALIGYDLAPEIDMDGIVGQIRAGLAWLYRHAPDYGIDPARLFVAGHSAGGHLSAMALCTDWAELGLPPDLVKGVCAISGVFNLDPIRSCYLNDVLGLTQEQVMRHSPIRLAPRTRCPVLLTVGERETGAFLEQSRRYADHLRRAGVPCDLALQPKLDHFGIIEAMALPENAAVQWIRRHMGLVSST